MYVRCDWCSKKCSHGSKINAVINSVMDPKFWIEGSNVQRGLEFIKLFLSFSPKELIMLNGVCLNLNPQMQLQAINSQALMDHYVHSFFENFHRKVTTVHIIDITKEMAYLEKIRNLANYLSI